MALACLRRINQSRVSITSSRNWEYPGVIQFRQTSDELNEQGGAYPCLCTVPLLGITKDVLKRPCLFLKSGS